MILMKIITFQKFTWNHLFYIAYLIIARCRKILTEPLLGEKTEKSGCFFLMYNTVLSQFLSIIPYLIRKYLSKSASTQERKDQNKDNKLNYIYNDKNDYTGRGLIEFTLLTSVVDFVAEASILIFYFFNDEPEVLSLYTLNSYLIINTVTQYISGYFILKTYFYKHHYLSFIIILFVSLSL